MIASEELGKVGERRGGEERRGREDRGDIERRG
jgi:hypothetical protein